MSEVKDSSSSPASPPPSRRKRAAPPPHAARGEENTDIFTAEKRSAVMRRVKSRDTRPELAVRSILRAAGIGYRLGGCGLSGKPDVAMKGRRIALFVHGCFWHGHDCARGSRQPKANADYWRTKISRNRERDARNDAALTEAGWRVITVWECEMRSPHFAADLVAVVRA